MKRYASTPADFPGGMHPMLLLVAVLPAQVAICIALATQIGRKAFAGAEHGMFIWFNISGTPKIIFFGAFSFAFSAAVFSLGLALLASKSRTVRWNPLPRLPGGAWFVCIAVLGSGALLWAPTRPGPSVGIGLVALMAWVVHLTLSMRRPRR